MGDGEMGRSSRLFEIVQLLRHAHRAVSARAIADVLEVSQRTVYRDIAALQALHVPIEGEAGVGYVMRTGFDLSHLTFTVEEVEAIAVGLALIGRTRDADLDAAAFRVSRKITDVLPTVDAARIKWRPLYVSLWNTVPPTPIDYRVMRQAIREERRLHLKYQDAGARSTERTIRPIALVYYVESAILAAWCELRQDFRHFRVDRIKACQPIDGLFKGESAKLHADWKEQHLVSSGHLPAQ
jgi:predicted DNA-binding transcriptional regulator YafY